ncbi:MAG: hypothetical protein IPM54_29570 [Polyangiaceae bacterium]|nr:hypothetical protein [Polyangiaceae bacterium]
MVSASTTSRLIHRVFTKTLLASYGMFLVLGGCTWSPFGPDKGDAGSDAAPELEHCTLKAQACTNKCMDLGSACMECCERNARSCDSDGSYSFYSCPDAK